MSGGNLASPTNAELEMYLAEQHAAYVSSARIVDQTIFLVVDAQRVASVAHESHQTSKRKLAALERALRERFEVDVQISVSSDDESERVKQVVHGVLARRFDGLVTDVTAALLDAETASVWLDAENVTDLAIVEQITQSAKDALDLLGLTKSSVHVQSPVVSEPTLLAILRAAKIHAPLTVEQLHGLLSKEYVLPSVQWVASKLDLARKHRLVIRDRDGRFSLTELGLSVAPAGRGRNSSDVARALRLIKHKWE